MLRVQTLLSGSSAYVKNHNDKSYGQGKKIDNDIYDLNGFDK